MDIDFSITGQRIREARKLRGMTAEILAEKVGLATESLRHIENASSKPSLQTLFRIASVLNVSLDYITGRIPQYSTLLSNSLAEDQSMTEAQKNMLTELLQVMIPTITKYL